MNFLVDSINFCINDKGRIYRKFRRKPSSHVEHVRIGAIRPESNAPINSIEMRKFYEMNPSDLREIADLVDSYVSNVYGENPPLFAGREVGVIGD